MNEKITLPGLTQLLALRSGDTKKQSEDFIKEFFAIISNVLAEGEPIKIKGLGVFKTIGVEARKSVNVSTGEDHEIPAHRKVVFVASKELAALVNEPFDMFETVEIGDDVTFEEDDQDISDQFLEETDSMTDDMQSDEEDERMESSVDSVNEPESESADTDLIPGVDDASVDDLAVDDLAVTDNVSTEETPSEKPSVSVTDDAVISDSSDEVIGEMDEEEDFNVYTVDETLDDTDEDISAAGSFTDSVPESDDSHTSDNQPAAHFSENERHRTEHFREEWEEEKTKSRFGVGFLAGFVAAVVLAFVFYVILFGLTRPSEVVGNNTANYSSIPSSSVAGDDEVVDEIDSVKPASEAQAVVSDEDDVDANAEEVPTSPSDKKVYDTISKTRYLTTMAKDHYGNYNLWPIIYEENKAFLGHPDRIRPGTRVVVPPLSKYGVDPDNPEDIARAKKKGVEIYARYK